MLIRIILGSSIMIGAAIMLAWHIRTWRSYRDDSSSELPDQVKQEVDSIKRKAELNELDDSTQRRERLLKNVDESFKRDTLRYFRSQSRHRCLIAIMIGTVGFILASLGFIRHPTVITFGILLMLALIVVIMFGAILDAFRTHAFYRKHDQGFKLARQALINEYERLKSQLEDSNDNNEGEATS